MKKYNKFINENRAYGKDNKHNNMDFNFFILLENVTAEKQKEAFEEFNQYVNLEEHNKKNLLITKSDIDYFKNSDVGWVWYVKIYESWGNSAIPRDTIDFLKMRTIDIRSNDNLIITLDEFLKIGLKGVETFYKVKKDAKKFNL